ncbi:hypothetical protein Raf01_14030 [Rugosimonospora africana]|uniref:Uncharacterized protein n=1 Tax=Rugosimonospora africana TaxID=556532 RepID=A0A8J3QMB5_9ACTN|nr:hypothetical protein Raf01_14030 [Rugosimonospora africana]
MYRLEPVPYVRQRPPDDHAHRVVEVGALHLDFEADRLDAPTNVQFYRSARSGAGGVARLGRVDIRSVSHNEPS